MTTVPKEAAQAMAEWWADKVAPGARHDNGDHNSMTSALAGILADTLNKPADEASRNKFVELLSDAIQKEPNLYSLNHKLSCDYSPTVFLSNIAKEAGINANNFPWKTGMVIRNKNLEVFEVMTHDGYGAPWNILCSGTVPKED